MPVVTLLRPARLGRGGTVWEKDVPVTVGMDLAKELAKDPRFFVEGIPGRPVEVGKGKARPANRRMVLVAIKQAIEKLDVSDSDAWTDDGLPNPYAVSFETGFKVTAEDIVEANGGRAEEAAASKAKAQKKAEPKKDAKPAARPTVRVSKTPAKGKAEDPPKDAADKSDTPTETKTDEGGTDAKDDKDDGKGIEV